MRPRILNKFFSFSWRRRLLLFEAVVLTAVARLALLLPFRWVAPFLGRHMQEAGEPIGPQPPTIADVQWAIAAVSYRLPWQCKCLVQAIAARLMLGRRGLSGTLYLGVTKDDESELHAHAWLKTGSATVGGGRGVNKFTVVSKFAFGSRNDKHGVSVPKSVGRQRNRWTQRIGELLRADYCPILIRWNLFRQPSEIDRIRRLASRHHYSGHPLLIRWSVKLFLLATWPVRAFLQTIRFTHRFSRKATEQTGKSRIRQGAEQMCLAIGQFLPPSVYYRYEVFVGGGRVDYLHQPEAQRLFTLLNRHTHRAIGDKREFARLCEQHDLPTPQVVGICERGQVQFFGEPPQSFFLKPAVGCRGEGAIIWKWVEKGVRSHLCEAPEGPFRQMTPDPFFDRHDGLRLVWDELVQSLQDLSWKTAYVIQPCLQNHADVAELSSGALAAARIVTGRLPNGDVGCVVAAFRMPVGSMITNTHGLSSPIDLTTGVLGRADSCRPLCAGFDTHPDTGKPITGKKLPDWPLAVEYCRRAHGLFPGYVFLGWDVALTPSGPMLLEGNAVWDVISVQRPHRTPLIETTFSEICAAWLDENRTRRQAVVYRIPKQEQNSRRWSA